MRSGLRVLVFVLLVSAWVAAQRPASSKGEPQMKSVTGQVVDGADRPIPNAVVYLKNTKTLAVKTFISQDDGSYQFNGLSPNADYDLHAEANGQRSDNKTISQFDSRTNVTIHLKIKK